jgi:hypothetical protein
VGLPWVRLDTAFPSNPKLLGMLAEKDGHRAALAYICALCHAGAHGTDGFISREVLPYIHARMSDADRLVRHGFWIPRPGGWMVNGWAEKQESTGETRARSARAQAAAEIRWAKARANGDLQ